MLGSRKNVSPASVFFLVVNCLSMASAFRHEGQFSTASHLCEDTEHYRATYIVFTVSLAVGENSLRTMGERPPFYRCGVGIA
jgi:hypothetical protein